MAIFSLGQIVAALGGELHGHPDTPVAQLAPLGSAGPQSLSFLASHKYTAQLAQSLAACVVVSANSLELALQRGAAIVVADPYLYYARLSQWWVHHTRGEFVPFIHPAATIDAQAQLGPGVRVGPGTVIEAGAVIGANVEVGAQCFIGPRAHIGPGSQLAAQVVIGQDCQLGQCCIVHSGAVIGADGFGFAARKSEGQPGWEKIMQLGAVRIGDHVEIGANTCIDRGALEDTVIGDGVKLDNLIQIAHNARIGAHTALAGCVGVAGSAVIGAHCTIGGAANILGHLTLADHVHISAASVVTRSILRPGHYSGIFPIDDNLTWEKNAASLKQLHVLRNRVRALEKKSP